MNEFMKVLFSLSVSGTLLLLLISGLKPLYKTRFSKRWQYYIWIIAALRFLLPFTPPLPTGSALRMKVNSLRVLCAPDGHSRVRTGHTEPAGCPMHSLQALPESGEPPDCSPVSPMLFCKYQLLLLISVFLFLHFMENLHKFLAGNGLLFNQKLRNLIEAFPVL